MVLSERRERNWGGGGVTELGMGCWGGGENFHLCLQERVESGLKTVQ